MTTYEPPLDRLLTLGASNTVEERWPNYPALGITHEHVPALVRMATDAWLLHEARSPEAWGTIHALRALGQLRAAAVVESLVPLLDAYEPDEVGANELRIVLGMIGPAALPLLTAYLGRREADVFRRGLAGEAIAQIARRHPAARGPCIAVLADALGHFAVQPPELNGLLVGALLDLQATEAVDVIERAYAADAVDVEMNGDWEDVQVELGLLAQRVSPPPTFAARAESLSVLAASIERYRHEHTGIVHAGRRVSDVERKRAATKKRKQAAASRRRNRRRG